ATEPALSWPLKIFASQEAHRLLDYSPPVRLGYAELVPREARPDGPYMAAEIVEFGERSFHGKALALRFLDGNSRWRELPYGLDFSKLWRMEPAVFLPLQGREGTDEFAKFVDGLTHNLPIDVAA